MPDTIIKHFFIFLCCLYTYHRLLNHNLSSKSQKIAVISLSITFALFTFFLKIYLPSFSNIFPVIILGFILGSISSRPKLSFVTAIISFGFSYGIFVISCSIILALSAPFLYNCASFPYYCFMFFSGLLECLLILSLFHVKRFQKGMPFLYSTNFINVGSIICLLCLAVITYLQISASLPLLLAILIPISLITAIFALILWWQNQLTKSYLTKLRLLELESLRNELQNKELLLSKLQKENEELGRLIHKDNKLIPAMENAVYEYLASTTPNDERTLSLGTSLLRELHNLSENRKDLLTTISNIHSQDFSTGLLSLDALLSYMDKQSQLVNIKFSVNIPANLTHLIPSKMQSDDLIHLLADLIENAIIATSSCPDRKIYLQIYLYHKTLIIELADTGIPFSISSFTNLGHKPFTTHPESGGSGIGLMDIWKIKNKYNASIHITEYNNSFPFRKKISFLLDKKNQYWIYSWRYEEIIAATRRTDLFILPNTDTTNPLSQSFL